jgi:hypothetical protein
MAIPATYPTGIRNYSSWPMVEYETVSSIIPFSGAHGIEVVEALCYKHESRGFETR